MIGWDSGGITKFFGTESSLIVGWYPTLLRHSHPINFYCILVLCIIHQVSHWSSFLLEVPELGAICSAALIGFYIKGDTSLSFQSQYLTFPKKYFSYIVFLQRLFYSLTKGAWVNTSIAKGKPQEHLEFFFLFSFSLWLDKRRSDIYDIDFYRQADGRVTFHLDDAQPPPCEHDSGLGSNISVSHPLLCLYYSLLTL